MPPPPVRDGDWTCTESDCNASNFARRTECFKCGKGRDFKAWKKQKAKEIGGSEAKKSGGLFSADDWRCNKCGNINWARRNTCNMCNAPKVEDDERTGFGGGFNDRQDVEYIDRDSSGDEIDDFGRKKKKFRSQLSNDDEKPRKEVLKPGFDGQSREVDDEDDDDDEDASKYNLDDDDTDEEHETNKGKNVKSEDRKIAPKVQQMTAQANSKKSAPETITRNKRASSSSSSSSASSAKSRSTSSSSGSNSKRSRSRSRGRKKSSSRSRSRSRGSRSNDKRKSRKRSHSSRRRSRSRSSSRRRSSSREKSKSSSKYSSKRNKKKGSR